MYNVAVGYHAGFKVSTGTSNTLIGGLAGDALTDADSNVAVGRGTLSADTKGGRAVAIGQFALASQNFTTTTNSYNVGVGYNAGVGVTTGTFNTLIGGLAGDALTDADYNTAIGTIALGSDTLGSRSTVMGYGALQTQNFTTATDSYNVAVGYNAGASITIGEQNTFIGGLAGDGTDDGYQNVAIGYESLTENCQYLNVSVGRFALRVSTAHTCTSVGSNAGMENSTGDNNLYLGFDSGRSGSPGGSNTTGNSAIFLGDENIGDAHIQVDWTVASDQRDKTDFTDLDLGLDFVKALAPVTYKWDKRSKYGDKTADDYDLLDQTPDGTHKEDWLDIGFKAQEVEALEIAAGYNKSNKTNLTTSLTSDGKQYGIQYSKFVPILVKAIQEQNALIEALTARIATLEG